MTNLKPVQFFSNKQGNIGINVVKSPVKLTILEMLRNNEMEFEEIVRNTGKSKSTISVHLKSLREENIISYKIDSNDNRKKIFYLNSEYLGSMDVSSSRVEDENVNVFIKELIASDEPFSTLLYQTFRSMLIKEGVNIDPILNNTGKKIGSNLFEELYSKNLDDFIDNISQYWENKGLGILTSELGQIIKISTKDCFECKCLPRTGRPICYLDAGIFESLFSLYFDMPVKVTEIKCYTMGDEMCTFEIEALGK
ncbi:MAG: ArsR family transcriptional regulator [Methanobrevibacter sp.]|nr:V4R domain-containing protein [Methanobrevibacter sp.]MDO5848628.1 ArsR family transcriptional regulator [Methanobrevibacter sp.]